MVFMNSCTLTYTVHLHVHTQVCTLTCTYTSMYHITGYLCNPEICAFWQKMAICIYLCMALHGVWLSLP